MNYYCYLYWLKLSVYEFLEVPGDLWSETWWCRNSNCFTTELPDRVLGLNVKPKVYTGSGKSWKVFIFPHFRALKSLDFNLFWVISLEKPWITLNCPQLSKSVSNCHSPLLFYPEIQMKIVLEFLFKTVLKSLEIALNSTSSPVYGPCKPDLRRP